MGTPFRCGLVWWLACGILFFGLSRWSRPMAQVPPPAFHGVWLEPAALGFFAWPVPESALRQLVQWYHAHGMDLLLVAYVEFGGCLYYPSHLAVQWTDYSSCQLNTQTYWYTCASPPKVVFPLANGGDRCPWVGTYDFVEVLLSEADRLGMKVMLGLGRSGDWAFALALEDYYLFAKDAIPNQIDPVLLNTRLGTIWTVSTAIAQDLWTRYKHHTALNGFIINHELTCYDVMRNLTDPVTTTVKQLTSPTLPVMVTPYSVRTCIVPTSAIPEQIRAGAVDIFLYQDAVGSSATAPAFEGDPRIRIAELPQEYREIAGWHATGGKALWASVEIWRAAPNWDQRDSLTGPWYTEGAVQLRHAAHVAQMVVVNEGLFYIDHAIPALTLPQWAKYTTGRLFTQDYETGRGAAPP